ncbi:MAG: branched-chain amino acid ABC transporter permease [bacterium]|nr:branched-chain amino acid ABC transporter permease [bacterium]MDT8365638.1 branched-chain amino acid ABC transporter permease [bacterium]
MWFFLQLVIQGLAVGSVYALVALGFVLIYKASSVINFAQGELLMVGAYICLVLLTTFQVPFWAAFFLTMAFSVILALVIERLVLRPMIGEPAISIIMITIGLSLVLKSSIAAIWGTQIKVFPPIFPQTPIKLGEIMVSQVYIYTFLASMVFLLLFALFFKYSRMGIAMRATANSNQVALSMGISVKKVFAISWCVAAVVSAVGGILIGNINGVNSTLGSVGLKVFPAVILGGLDSIPGAVIGGLIIGILENLSGGYLDHFFGGGVKEVAPFVILVVILMIKPYGLFGTEEIERV